MHIRVKDADSVGPDQSAPSFPTKDTWTELFLGFPLERKTCTFTVPYVFGSKCY